MSREQPGYRENLQDILEFFDGRRLLTLADVQTYTGIVDRRTVKNRYPFRNNRISAPTLALYMSGGGDARDK